MRIEFYKATWGMEGTLEEWIPRIARAGYDGLEIHPGELPEDFSDQLARHGLKWSALVGHHDADELCDFMERVAVHRPVLFNSHSGLDSMTTEEAVAFLRKVDAKGAELGIPVAHETHRQRIPFSPFSTRDLMKALPEVRLTADFSHWTCVCERMLEDLDDIVEEASRRTIHLHARIGFPEGPQVCEPRAPEYAEFARKFETWWTRIKEMREADGTECLIVVPEYGPPNYMHTVPYTRQPLANLWDVCLWQTNRLRELWGIA